eukprot:TRINITY_DN30210_c0_g1_i1.p1 TRINITY_DN30210_c0_g1~~TRINITY_DN30210_c0_g1_i1.p1  ORF type:complete len:459 (+),score=81.67 TRINITY_DN30210_c0_g1_i1:72-1379(+)
MSAAPSSPPPPGSPYSSEQLRVSNSVVAVAASLSLVGSLLICATYAILRNRAATHINLRLLVWLSASDAFACVVKLFNVQYGAEDSVCDFFGFLETAADLFPVMWTAAMSCALLYTVFRAQRSGRRGDQFIGRYCLVCFGFPLLLALLGLALGIYGRDTSGETCWISNGNSSIRLAFFFVPLWLVIAFNTLAYWAVHRAFKQALDRHSHPMATSAAAGSKAHRLKYYPAVLVWTWFFGTVDRILEWGGVHSFPVFLLHSGLGRTQGLWNCLVYGADPVQEFRSILVGQLCCDREGNGGTSDDGRGPPGEMRGCSGQSESAAGGAVVPLGADSAGTPHWSNVQLWASSPRVEHPEAEQVAPGHQGAGSRSGGWGFAARKQQGTPPGERSAQPPARGEGPPPAPAAPGDDFSEVTLSSPRSKYQSDAPAGVATRGPV